MEDLVTPEFLPRRNRYLIKLNPVIENQETEESLPLDPGPEQGLPLGQKSQTQGKKEEASLLALDPSYNQFHPLQNSLHILYIPLVTQHVVIKLAPPRTRQ